MTVAVVVLALFTLAAVAAAIRARRHARRLGEAVARQGEDQARRGEGQDRQAEGQDRPRPPAAGAVRPPVGDELTAPQPAPATLSPEPPAPVPAAGAPTTDAPPTTAPAPDTAGPAGADPSVAVVEALWGLSVAERHRIRREDAAVSTAEPGWRPDGLDLQEALAEEVGRRREETGTPGTLDVDLPGDPGPGQSMVALRAVQGLLDALGRHCQAYDLYVHHFEDRLLAVVVLDGFDGPDTAADDTAAVLAALGPVDGRLEVDRDSEGRLRARLSLPVTFTAAAVSTVATDATDATDTTDTTDAASARPPPSSPSHPPATVTGGP